MEQTQAVDQVEFGLTLLRLSRAISDQPVTDGAELEEVLQKTPARRGRLAS
jgi:hypothetical protein